MADVKKVKMLARHPVWTGTERAEPGTEFVVTADLVKRLEESGVAEVVGEVKEPKSKQTKNTAPENVEQGAGDNQGTGDNQGAGDNQGDGSGGE